MLTFSIYDSKTQPEGFKEWTGITQKYLDDSWADAEGKKKRHEPYAIYTTCGDFLKKVVAKVIECGFGTNGRLEPGTMEHLPSWHFAGVDDVQPGVLAMQAVKCRPDLTLATADHNVPTSGDRRLPIQDPISAKQVAYYVRSEFASVAVVPVSPQEKTRAPAPSRCRSSSLTSQLVIVTSFTARQYQRSVCRA